jgi:zinc-finger of transposase IS204/IS1001/IS1096/IS1165
VLSLSQVDGCLPCPGAVDLGILLPHLAGVIIEGAVAAAGLLLVLARARAGTAACPACGSVSGRVHSRYVRRLADAAIGGRRVVIQLTVRRLFCADPGCKRRTFAEQVPGLTVRYARLGPAHRPALRPRRHLAGTRRRTLAGTACQQARPVQGLPGPAHGRGLRQRRPAVPGNPGTRLRRQLLRRPRLP